MRGGYHNTDTRFNFLVPQEVIRAKPEEFGHNTDQR